MGGDHREALLDYFKRPLHRKRLEVAAWIRETQEEWAAALVLWRNLLEFQRKTRGREPFVVNTMRWLSKCAEHAGDAREALEWRRKEMSALMSAAHSEGRPLMETKTGTASLFSQAFTCSDRSGVGRMGLLQAREERETAPDYAQQSHTLQMLALRIMRCRGQKRRRHISAKPCRIWRWSWASTTFTGMRPHTS